VGARLESRRVPTFCRHNRFIENCTICSRDLPGGSPRDRAGARSGAARPRAASNTRTREARPRADGLKVRRETRATDDGYRSGLVPGLRASADAQRLADEIAFANARLITLGEHPPGTYAVARDEPHLEQGSWTALLTVYLSPLEHEDDPFRSIRQALTSWSSGELPDLADLELGPRTSHDPARGAETLVAYRQWAERGGSQQAALAGDDAWSPSRRFDRAFERLGLPGLTRAARFDLLVTLGRLGLYELEADSLQLIGDDAVTVAAKRVFGIGDRPNLERRARALSEAIEVPLAALDLGLANWAAPERMTLGLPATIADEAAVQRGLDALDI